MRLPLKGAGTIPKRSLFNNAMCFWRINKPVSQSRVCVCVGSSGGNGMSSLPEAFRPSEAAWTRQHHLPGKLRRTGLQQELLHSSQKLGWAVEKCPKARHQRDTHLLLLQPQFCPCLARLHSEAWRNSARANLAQQNQGSFTSTQELTRPSHQSSEEQQSCGNKSCCPDEVLCLLSRDWVG